MNYPIVLVRWVDSGREALGWTELSKVDIELPTVESVGFLFSKTSEKIVLLQSISKEVAEGEDGEVLFVLTIPMGCVTRVVHLHGEIHE